MKEFIVTNTIGYYLWAEFLVQSDQMQVPSSVLCSELLLLLKTVKVMPFPFIATFSYKSYSGETD